VARSHAAGRSTSHGGDFDASIFTPQPTVLNFDQKSQTVVVTSSTASGLQPGSHTSPAVGEEKFVIRAPHGNGGFSLSIVTGRRTKYRVNAASRFRRPKQERSERVSFACVDRERSWLGEKSSLVPGW
jgi:hypothetical protein